MNFHRRSTGLQAPRWPFTINRASHQANGLLAAWPLMGDTGATLRDLTGRFDLTCDLSASGWQPTIFGAQSFRVNTAGSLAATYAPLVAVPSSDFTLAFWVKKDAASVDEAALGWVEDSDGLGIYFRETFSSWTEAIRIRYKGANYLSSNNVTSANWHHVALVRSGTSGTVYVDGRSAGSVTMTNVITAASFRLGTWVLNQDMNGGNLFGVAVHTRALTPSEVWALYDPATRWDLYYELGRRTYFFPTGGGGGATFIPRMMLLGVGA